MPEAQENSVLTSLKELRRQEEERVKQERASAEAKAQAERQAREESERRAKEEAEQARREEENRKKRAEEEKLAREREERLRVEEAERRARIEAEMKLQHERMRLEVEAKAAAQGGKPAPKGLIIGIVIGVLVIGAGVVAKIKSDHAADEAQARAVAQKERDELLRKQQEQELAFQAQIAKLTRQLSEAKSDADREALRQQIEQANSRRATAAAATRARSPKESASKPEAPQNLIKAKKQVSNDPLDGL